MDLKNSSLEEVLNTLNDKFVSRCEIKHFIDDYIKEKANFGFEEKNKGKGATAEKLDMLERRVAALEHRLDSILEDLAKTEQTQAKQNNIISNARRGELRSINSEPSLLMITNPELKAAAATAPEVMNKTMSAITINITTIEDGSSAATLATKTIPTITTTQKTGSTKTNRTKKSGKIQTPTKPEVKADVPRTLKYICADASAPEYASAMMARPRSNHDDLYYEYRQCAFNLLYYKKSETSLQLNKRVFNHMFRGAHPFN